MYKVTIHSYTEKQGVQGVQLKEKIAITKKVLNNNVLPLFVEREETRPEPNLLHSYEKLSYSSQN